MMSNVYDVAIIGAGTAGLTAQEEVVKHTDNYVLIDDGPLGTTCARVGCMPSKALIAVADDFHKCGFFDEYGIHGARGLTPDYKRIMARVRSMRDEFSGGVIREMSGFMDKVIRKRARFLDPNTLDLGDETIRAARIIIATGSKPSIPAPWLPFKHFIIDTDQFFELDTLPRTMAVFGLGVIGIELGQALHRLGIEVTAVSRRKTAGGLTDPELARYAFDHFSREMPVELGTAEILGSTGTGLAVGCGGKRWTVDRVLMATGRRPMLQGLNLECLNIDLDAGGMPAVDPETLQVANLPVFLAGDANGFRPILHEAADDGTIAGYNAIAGLSHKALTEKGIDFVVGDASWEELGRARMILGNAAGRARIYADPQKGRLLGAEIMAPAGEHMAHLLAWAMGADLTIKEILGMPFYHPVPEEALLDAFLHIAAQISDPVPMPILEKITGRRHGK